MNVLYEHPFPAGYPSEAADGTPHLTYFADDTSFVWSGSAERPVQVCPGGYGEPVNDTFYVTFGGDGTTVQPPPNWVPLHLALAEFRRACDEYLRAEERER